MTRTEFPDWCIEMLKLPVGSVKAKDALVAALVERYGMSLARARMAIHGDQAPAHGKQRYKVGSPCK